MTDSAAPANQPAAPPSAAPAPGALKPPPTLADSPRREVMIGGGIIFAFFFLFLGWAAFAPLDSGAYAPGRVAVAGNRQAVQHRDGGVVSALHVREGQTVKQGDILVEIAAGEVRATERGLAGQVLPLLAQRARLSAERDGLAVIPTPVEFNGLSEEDAAIAQAAMRTQQQNFSTRSHALSTQGGVLRERASQLNQQITGYQRQLEATREQSVLIADELAGIRSLHEQGYAPITRVRQLERTASELRGREGQLQAEIARANDAIGETRMQMLSITGDTQEEVAELLRQAETQLNDLQPRWRAAKDQLARAQVRAPASGQVVGLTVFTVGGVVSPGQVLMEVVPGSAALVVEARVSPNDADDLNVGQETEVRFTAFQERDLPILHGKLTRLSADSFVDEQSGLSYFTATVEVPPAEMAKLERVRGVDTGLRPGLPVEVLVPLKKRTALQYLVEPLQQSLWRSFREP